MDAPLFRDRDELAREFGSFLNWPAPERLLLKCETWPDVAGDGMIVEAVLIRERLAKVVDRATRRGIISEPQAWVMRQALSGTSQ